MKYAEYETCAIQGTIAQVSYFVHFLRFNSNKELIIDLLSALRDILSYNYYTVSPQCSSL